MQLQVDEKVFGLFSADKLAHAVVEAIKGTGATPRARVALETLQGYEAYRRDDGCLVIWSQQQPGVLLVGPESTTAGKSVRRVSMAGRPVDGADSLRRIDVPLGDPPEDRP
jgi:hypothetical protein